MKGARDLNSIALANEGSGVAGVIVPSPSLINAIPYQRQTLSTRERERECNCPPENLPLRWAHFGAKRGYFGAKRALGPKREFSWGTHYTINVRNHKMQLFEDFEENVTRNF